MKFRDENERRKTYEGFWSDAWPVSPKALAQAGFFYCGKEQGQIHGYPSCMRVGRGCILGHLIIWAELVRPKTARKKQGQVGQ